MTWLEVDTGAERAPSWGWLFGPAIWSRPYTLLCMGGNWLLPESRSATWAKNSRASAGFCKSVEATVSSTVILAAVGVTPPSCDNGGKILESGLRELQLGSRCCRRLGSRTCCCCCCCCWSLRGGGGSGVRLLALSTLLLPGGTDKACSAVDDDEGAGVELLASSEVLRFTLRPPRREPPRMHSCCSRMHRSQGGRPGSPLLYL